MITVSRLAGSLVRGFSSDIVSGKDGPSDYISKSSDERAGAEQEGSDPATDLYHETVPHVPIVQDAITVHMQQ